MCSDARGLSYFLTVASLILIGISSRCEAQDYTIVVSAGGFDRSGTIVSMRFPGRVEAGVYRLQSEEQEPVYLQVDRHNTGRFILNHLRAGSSRSYTMMAKPVSLSSSSAGITYDTGKNTISFQSDGRDILSYFKGPNNPPADLDKRYVRGGYIQPVYSPEGAVLTNDLDTVEHPHHYGVWAAWTHTEFQGRSPDFWNVQDNTGRVDHDDSLEVVWKGPVFGGFKAKNYYVDLSAPVPVIALNEEWKVLVYHTAGDKYNIFDLVVTQTTNTGQPLVLPEYRYGGVAIRGNAEWDDPAKVSFLTSKGYDRNNGNATRARWVHMGGTVNGNRAGIAVLGHPDNFRAPQPVRIHPTIPYFVYAPSELGRMSITAGSPYVVRYRYVSYDGKPDPEELNRLWNDYAYPPGVTVTAHRNNVK